MKNRLIIVEGPQGTGKTTLSNYLRENMPGSNLYRLSGQKDKTEKGKIYSEKMYTALLDYLEKLEEIPINLIFDRTFFTEEIYSRLGYKEYNFSDIYKKLLEKFNKLDFEKYLIILYLENTDLYSERLKRESHHNYQAFSLENSANQQQAYLKLSEEIEKDEENTIKIIRLPMDDFKKSYQQIENIMRGENDEYRRF